MLDNIIHNTTGWFHFIASLTALITGSVVLLNSKGTIFHKRVGYVYVISMYLLNISSFFITNFNGFSIFHVFAIISLVTISVGMITMWLNVKHKIIWHYYAMSWSVVGLYCAFWAELGTRFVGNMREFWWVVVLATVITSLIGHFIISKQSKKLHFK